MGSLCDTFDHMPRTLQTAMCPKEEESNKSYGFDIPNITKFPDLSYNWTGTNNINVQSLAVHNKLMYNTNFDWVE
jgi:hypothetical protein